METRYGAPVAGDEKAQLEGFLDHYRQTLLDICEGLPFEDLSRSVMPSGTSLLGIVKHLSYVERGWFVEGIAQKDPGFIVPDGDPDFDWRIEPGETADQIFQMYRDACDEARAALADVSLDDLTRNPRRSSDYNVRWILVHMIEETARHCGHADILRELIDGRTETGYV